MKLEPQNHLFRFLENYGVRGEVDGWRWKRRGRWWTAAEGSGCLQRGKEELEEKRKEKISFSIIRITLFQVSQKYLSRDFLVCSNKETPRPEKTVPFTLSLLFHQSISSSPHHHHFFSLKIFIFCFTLTLSLTTKIW